MTESRPFGRSLHADFYEVDPSLCDDIGFNYALLDDIVTLLKMTKQAPPFVFRSPSAAFPEKAGLSGWVPLIESGISVHTLTLTGFVSLDIYTCGQLDLPATLAFLCERLGTTRYESHLLERGKEYGSPGASRPPRAATTRGTTPRKQFPTPTRRRDVRCPY